MKLSVSVSRGPIMHIALNRNANMRSLLVADVGQEGIVVKEIDFSNDN